MPFPIRIAGLSPFSEMSVAEREQLAKVLEERSFAPGDSVYSAGETSQGLFILVSGAVVAEEPDASTPGANAERIGEPGTFLSRGSLLSPFSHRHNVRAIEETSLLYLPREAFESLFAAGAGAAFILLDYLIREISAEIRVLNRGIQELMRTGPG